MGYSRPLLPWIVTSCTAAASESRRRVRSEATSSLSSATCVRSQPSRPTTPNRSLTVTLCSASPMWRRSVSVRSPPTRPSTRAVSPSSTALSSTAATPRAANTSARRRTCSLRASVGSSSPWSSSAVRPKKSVSAAARTRSARCGCSSASSRVSHWVAAAVLKTDPPALSTAGTPTAASASWAASRSARRAASTATSFGSTERSSSPVDGGAAGRAAA